MADPGLAILEQKKHYSVFAASCSHPKTTGIVSTVKNPFSSWKTLNPRIEDHKNSSAHCFPFLECKDMELLLWRREYFAMIVFNKRTEIKKKTNDILKRIIVIIHTFAKQNLALRGHQESIFDDLNPGNFSALIKYLSKLLLW